MNHSEQADPLTPKDRAARLFIQAETLGTDTPTEMQLIDTIGDAEFDALNFPEVLAKRHNLKNTPYQKLRRALNEVAGDLAERLARDLDHDNYGTDVSRKWYAAVKRARSLLQ